MIRFTLKCGNDHRFESWFRDNQAYESLCAAGQIACPECGDSAVVKAPMAPYVATAREAERAETEAALQARLREALLKVRAAVEGNCENVGDSFAEEARKIHYGEAPHRGIYGNATDDEARELEDEDIVFSRLPWVDRGDS